LLPEKAPKRIFENENIIELDGVLNYTRGGEFHNYEIIEENFMNIQLIV